MDRRRKIRLSEIAYARSGDKGAAANIGVIAYTAEGYEFLRETLNAPIIEKFFRSLYVRSVVRYELPNLGALNFVLPGILDGGGSLSLRNDAQGKGLAQMLLELTLDVPEQSLPAMLRRKEKP